MKVYYILASLFIFSCTTQKQITSEKTQNDSIVYVNKIKIDSIKDFKIIELTKPTFNEFSLKCDSTYFNQSFKSGEVEYKIIKEKGEVKIVFKTDTITKVIHEKSNYKLDKKDSLQKVVTKSEILKTSVQKPSFLQTILNNIWKILFFIVATLWVINISLWDIVIKLFKLNKI